MRRRWYLLAFIGLLALALLATLPLRLAGLDGAGVTASSVTGTIWNGRLTDTNIRGLAIGDMETSLAPLALLGGTLQIHVVGAGLTAAIAQRPDGFAIMGLNGRAGPFDVGGIPISSVDFTDVDIDMRRGVCVAAAGQVQLRPAMGNPGEDVLIGTARCDGDAVVLPLASTSGKLRLDIRIDGNKRYKAVLAVDGASEPERLALLAAGFQPTANGLARIMEGGL